MPNDMGRFARMITGGATHWMISYRGKIYEWGIGGYNSGEEPISNCNIRSYFISGINSTCTHKQLDEYSREYANYSLTNGHHGLFSRNINIDNSKGYDAEKKLSTLCS
jgi:hypothetical protein